MLAKEMLDIIEFARKQIQRKSELDQLYFTQFIQPTWEAFVRVHNNYIESLREYTRLISEESCDIPSLINKIHQDYLYTTNLRDELIAAVNHIPTAKLKTREKFLALFTAAIADYFYNRRELFASYQKAENKVTLQYMPNEHGDPPATPKLRAIFEVNGYKYEFSPTQQVRSKLVAYLVRRNSATDRKCASRLIMCFAQDIQEKAKVVSNTYQRLRTELLT